MKVWLTLAGILIAIIGAVWAFGGRSDAPYGLSIIEELQCSLSGGCYWQDGYPVDPAYADLVIANVRPSNPGFLVPPWADPEPAPEQKARLQALLTCTNEDLNAGSEYAWPTQRSLYWDEGAPPPPTMIVRAEAGDADTMFDLGFGYLSGYSNLEDMEAAERGFEWMVRAAELGHVMAQTELGAAYSFGYFGQNVDYPAAREHLSAATEAGDPFAMLSLALLPPEQGQDLRQYAQARLELELQSAELCHNEAIAHIIERLRYGRGLAPDPALASSISRRLLGIDAVGQPELANDQIVKARPD